MTEFNKGKIEILDKTLKEGFIILPRSILRNPAIGRHLKCTYSLLLDYAWDKDNCFPGQVRLAKDLGISVRTVQRDLEELKKIKLVDWNQRGRNRTNIYYILSLKRQQKRDTTSMTHPDMTNLSYPDTTRMSYRIIKENNKKKEYKKTLTLPSSLNLKVNNVNDKIKNINTFDTEAIELAKELNDTKSIKYYQKLINLKNKGEITQNDIDFALEDTRRIMKTDLADNTNFLRNPAGWFVSIIKKITQKNKDKKNQELIANFKQVFLSKSKI
ncbi:MAG: helix-turn-helix domain-containing protein [Candidatus Delongbacteria bacterium]|nr:helix-turn-helix domain-containing protein [Candidatus Delongbacteria bacterium]